MENKATREEMLLTINNFLSTVAETIILATDIDLNTSYVVTSDWKDSTGEAIKLTLTGRALLDAYSKKGTSKCIEEIKIIEAKGNMQFVEKLYLIIKK